ncbi:DUF6332 family protein [Streptomyces sp. NBC_00433]
MPSGTHSQAERDATTVEIGYALLSGCFLGAVVFATLVGPVVVWDLPAAVDTLLLRTGGTVACALAVVRVVHVLLRHARRES